MSTKKYDVEPTGIKRKFEISFELEGIEVDTAIIELDQATIDVVDDDWRASLYPLYTPEDIAAHICRNMLVNNLSLADMDGWANHNPANAKIIEYAYLDDFEVTARELKDDGSNKK